MSQAAAPHAYEIKSASLPLVSFLLKNPDTSALQADMARRLGATPGFFDNDPVIIDLSVLEDPNNQLDLPSVCLMLRTHQMLPVAVRGANEHQLANARKAGLFEASDLSIQAPAAPRVETVVQEVIREVEVVREVQTGSGAAMVIDKPLRSGQHVYAKGRDLIVLAMVNPGAEIMADGHIHVYAPLRGKAIAGARGDEQARIFTSCLEAELISIAGTYRTSGDAPLPADVAGKAAQISLQGDKLVMQAL
ncbi:septum site-determining protein MinC [Limnohabitans sp. Rim8]|uniref:septum site-determining protein MinC n=1 Tax=Limnohabitans sp. Rim8 TaxID=1100718 RepID=UPI000D3CFB63|nr:septum site-determining protein MinC [Limnohabitans sp. Rim8]PUE61792.1 septum site-determining protein MinC [Limnohabitans sp. Rim8]